MGRISSIGYTGINKIITSRLPQYDKHYSHGELIRLMQELRKIDILSKSTSLKDIALLHPVIVKICNRSKYV